jgi:hypothetical protein
LKEHGALVEKKQLNELLMKVRKLQCLGTVWLCMGYVTLLWQHNYYIGVLCCGPFLIRAGMIGAQYMHLYVAVRISKDVATQYECHLFHNSHVLLVPLVKLPDMSSSVFEQLTPNSVWDVRIMSPKVLERLCRLFGVLSNH